MKILNKSTSLTLKLDEDNFRGDSGEGQGEGDGESGTYDPHLGVPGNQPTPMEFKEMTEEARQRLLKALKVTTYNYSLQTSKI
jgi:hypothetical protein